MEFEVLNSSDVLSKSFKKTAAEFFKDCPSIVEKIENKSYKKDDLEEIVKFYNSSDCNKAEDLSSKTKID